MIEALAMRQARAVAALVQRSAVEATKHELRAKGIKPQHMPMREIVAMAKDYIAQHRAELIAEARPIVDRWTEEGFFGKRAARSVRNVPKLRTLDDREQRECRGNGQ
jgi:hypothetical protein